LHTQLYIMSNGTFYLIIMHAVVVVLLL